MILTSVWGESTIFDIMIGDSRWARIEDGSRVMKSTVSPRRDPTKKHQTSQKTKKHNHKTKTKVVDWLAFWLFDFLCVCFFDFGDGSRVIHSTFSRRRDPKYDWWYKLSYTIPFSPEGLQPPPDLPQTAHTKNQQIVFLNKKLENTKNQWTFPFSYRKMVIFTDV